MTKEEIMKEMYDIQTRYSKPLLKKNYTDKDYIIKNYENLVLKIAKSQDVVFTNKELKEKIAQLETNRDEAIKYIENYKATIMGAYGIPMTKVNELLSILERGLK